MEQKLIEIWRRLDQRRRRLLMIFAEGLVRGQVKE